MKINTNKKDGSLPAQAGIVEILVTFDWAEIANHKDFVLKEIQTNYEADGFRPGNVPTEIIEKNISSLEIYERCTEKALQDKYESILKEANIDAIGRPMVTILKIAVDNPVEVKIDVAVYPQINLPDYKKIATEQVDEISKDKPDFETTDDELTKTFEELQQMRAHQKLHEKMPEDGGHAHDDHSHGEITPDMYPALDDEFAKSFGFDDLDAMRVKMRENVKKEKEQKHSDKSRIKIIEKIIETTNVDVPEILINAELDSMMHRMTHDVQMMGLKFDDYLKHINKTETDLRIEYTNDAKKRVASKLIIEEISKKESLKPNDAEIEVEVEKLLKQYPEADRVQTTMYVESILTNEKVFSFLEAKK